MANNNHPHPGHLSQAAQNPSWNPLQIPSYIPRQPQLAHMSNERPGMVRSPLAWHVSGSVSSQPPPPPPPEAIYNFMSANHKNLDHHHQMNPLLAPPYSGTLPFDSMDLSLQSARSAAQPLTKQPLSQQQQQQSLMHAPNYPSIQNLTTNASPNSAQMQQQQQQQGHLAAMAAAHASLLQSSSSSSMSNGGVCESLLPPPPPTSAASGNSSNHAGSNSSSSSGGSGSNNNIPSPQYMHSRDENFKLAQLKRSFDHELLSGKNLQKDKDCAGYPGAGTPSKLPTHNVQQQQHANKKPSPLRNYHQQQQQPPYNLTPKYNGPQTPPTPQSPLAAPPSHQLQSPTMDYNQLHLHQHHHQLNSSGGGNGSGNSYQHMQSDHSQHLHYHNQHVASQATAPPPPLLPPHLASAQFHGQQAQDAPPHLQVAPPSQQQQQTHHSRNAHHTNLDSLGVKHKPETEESTPVITDLSYRNAEADKPAANSLPDAPESPYLTTSNEESLESNSNSSNSRKRRKRKSSMVMRVTPNENAPEGGNTKQQQQPQQPLVHQGNSCSPKRSPKNGGGDFQPFSLQTQTVNDKAPQENGCGGGSPTAAENSSNSNSSTLYHDNDNPKTKKQRQALLQRNITEQQQQQRQQQEDEPPKKPTPPSMPPPSPQSNSSSSSSSSSSANSHSSRSSQASHDNRKEPKPEGGGQNKTTTDTPASPALVEQGDIDAKPAVSVHECDEEEEPAEPIKETPAESSAPPPTDPDVTKKASPAANSEPCPFGEVEDKLEEMFAGIEEESETICSPEKPAEEAVNHDLSAQLALDSAKPDEAPAEKIEATAAAAPPEIRPMATKAAMKSTMPSPVHSPAPQARSSTSTPLTAVEESKDNTPAAPATKAASSRRLPPRRLSMGMDASLLRFMIDESPPAKKPGRKKKAVSQPELDDEEDDDKPSTSAAAAAALAARQLSEAAAAPKGRATGGAKKKNAVGKGKKGAATKANAKNAKQNGKKPGRKPAITTDEDSTPAPTNGGGGGASGSAELRFKSPFILIKPDGSVSIKNTHSAEDVNEKQTKVKKAPHERKNLRGMHSSTLSNRYDADTTDSTWICVFCKRGPHKLGLGDLFGPYLVTSDCEEYRAALQAPGVQDVDGLFVSKRRREDMVKTQERNLPVVPATLGQIMQAPKISMVRKRKQTHDSTMSYSDDPNDSRSLCSSVDPLDCSHESKFIETFRGMGKTSEHGYEVWLHEDCAVWSNDIQLIGAHVNGLDAAVWDSTRYHCVLCQQTGASVCCFQRSCKVAAHVPCARSANWSLREEDRKVYCQLHCDNAEAGSVKMEPLTPAATAIPGPAPAPPPAFNVHSLP
ncbi:uncharacterized protein CG5098 isoform X1 [Drosophila serrata]|uniref:uncharacterized protein CG5098 isoform X1 n=2 Tax=Drosophila serrata TaxID=7274 RepID=UPI000A1CFEF8|nr:uncharacterized protein CG5098 isoform X1 [Drosophila serrata]